jgi:membrane-bound lytic murein transglycosylase A
MYQFLIKCFLVLAILSTIGCAQNSVQKSLGNQPLLTPIALSDLPGWGKDSLEKALIPLKKSCAKLVRKSPNASIGNFNFTGIISDWIPPCSALPIKGSDNETMRRYLAAYFKAYKLTEQVNTKGLITGYFEPILKGSLLKTATFSTPIYPLPKDLVLVSLGDWRTRFKGQRIAGKIVAGRLKPYFSRQAIRKGALNAHTTPILWLENDIDAFFLHIQGSGKISLSDGSEVRIGYAGHNGHTYVAIGRHLTKSGAIKKQDMSLQSIKRWLLQNPQQRHLIMDLNTSYVFFRKVDGNGPIGAQGVPLTAGRSLAIDRKFLPLGIPIWLNADYLDENGKLLQRLMVSQDTGGAIKGLVRGDVFWGSGEKALALAGPMKAWGEFYVFLPKSVAVSKNTLKK